MPEPTEEELVEFAANLLGRGHPISEPEALRETVREARQLWTLLYRTHDGEPSDDAHPPGRLRSGPGVEPSQRGV